MSGDQQAIALPSAGWYWPVVHAGDLTLFARSALHAAADEAHRWGQGEIHTGHLLLGLLRAREGMAARVLADAGIGYASAAAAIRDRPGRSGRRGRAGERAVRLSGWAGRALGLALRERRRRGDRRTGTDHLLLGLLASPDGAAGRALLAAGVGVGGVREELAAALRARDRAQGARTLPSPAGDPGGWMPTDRRRLLAAGTVLALTGVAGCGAPSATPRVPTTPYWPSPTPAPWGHGSAQSAQLGQLGHPLFEPALGVVVTGDTDPTLGPARGLPPVAGALIEPAGGDGRAARAGVRPGDVVVAVDGHDTPSWREFLALVQARRPGDEVELRIARAGADPAAPDEVTARLVIGQR